SRVAALPGRPGVVRLLVPLLLGVLGVGCCPRATCGVAGRVVTFVTGVVIAGWWRWGVRTGTRTWWWRRLEPPGRRLVGGRLRIVRRCTGLGGLLCGSSMPADSGALGGGGILATGMMAARGRLRAVAGTRRTSAPARPPI